MFLSNDLLLGILLGIAITVLIQQTIKASNRLLRPGCLLGISIVVVIFIVLVFTGIIQFQMFTR
ncbi:MAG: hypothetical protein AAFR81_23825 [Chloroflexota bacterium]